MDINSARASALDVLATLESPGTPLTLDEEGVADHRTWCYVFYWNSRRYLETGDPMSYVAGNGPIVVPTDGSPPFVLPTYEEPNVLLDQHEKSHGQAH